MSWFDEEEAKRDGRRDFEQRGRYGYDNFRYDEYGNAEQRAYKESFDEARREEEYREEQREEERQEELFQQHREQNARREQEQYELEQQMFEDDYYDISKESPPYFRCGMNFALREKIFGN